MASGRQVGELHVISINDTCPRWDSQVLPLAFLPRVLPQTHFNQPAQLARFDIQENGTLKLLFPVGAQRAKIEATACIRQSEQLLFLP